MQGIHSKPLVLAIAVCALGLSLQATPVYLAARQEVPEVIPCKPVTMPQQAAIISTGARVLHHIARARTDIGTREVTDAGKEIDRAESLLDNIQATLPTTDVTDWVQVAQQHLEYASPREVLPDLIPIYASLHELHDSMPTGAARQHLDQARKYLQSGDREKGMEALEAAAGALQYLEVELPLDSTRQMVSRARKDLNSGNWDAADSALQSAEDSTVYLSVAFQQPLFAAKALIWQTVLDLDAADTDLARSDFEGAIGYLELVSQTTDESIQQAAGRLFTQAKELQKDLVNDTDAGSGVRRLWEQTRALTARSLEYLAAGWERYRSEDPLKSSLIEARLHLANARIDQFSGRETARAREELQAVRRYLDQAAGQVNSELAPDPYQNQISSLQAHIEALGADPSAAREPRYAALQQTLQNMIRSL